LRVGLQRVDDAWENALSMQLVLLILEVTHTVMAGFKRSTFINRPVEAVFDFATDLNNLSCLLPNLSRAELLTDGGIRTGARIRETRGVHGKSRTAVIEVQEHKRPEVHRAGAPVTSFASAPKARAHAWIWTPRYAATCSGSSSSARWPG
jgi:Polyketide cyclase / dehydrase and lipid transport